MKKLMLATTIAIASLSFSTSINARDTSYWNTLKLINKQIRINTYYKTHDYMYNIDQFIEKTKECHIDTKHSLNEVVGITSHSQFYVSQVIIVNKKDVAVTRSHVATGDQFLMVSGSTGQMFKDNQNLIDMYPKFLVFKGFQTVNLTNGKQEELKVFEMLSLEKAPRLQEPKRQ